MKIVNKKRFITTISIILIMFFSVIVMFFSFTKNQEYTESHKTIYISKNETLWSIAKEYKKPNQDIRDYIYEIRKLNNMESATIYEGQELIIIVYEEVK